MPLRRSFCSSLLALTAAAAAACSTVHDDLSRQLLQPPPGWLAEPADAGLQAAAFEVPVHSEASFTGWWIPNAAAKGRTVVLFHAEDMNASVLHPYYTFLHAAGFQVLVFDPRGYGRSKGTATLRAWLYDLPVLLDWLRARPDVDPQQIAFFGTSLGSPAALWAAVSQGPCKALVLEHLPSLRDRLRASMADDGSALSAYAVGMAEYGLPEGIEAEDMAPSAKMPALFLAGAEESAVDRRGLLRAFAAYRGPRQLRVFSDTGRAPHPMVTHDGEHQRAIVPFLRGAFDAEPEQVVASWTKTGAAGDGHAWYEVQLRSVPEARNQPWAVEVCALLADGSPHFERTWLEGERSVVRMRLPQDPAQVAAVRFLDALGDDEGRVQRRPTALARSAATIAPFYERIDELRRGALARAACVQLAHDLRQAEAAEPFHARLAAELSDVFALLGKALSTSDDPAQRAEARVWLQRAVDAVPAKPKLHFWPGASTTWGFPQQAAVDEAARLLAQAPQ